jgi:nucleotide-binding universal stress UspA family protein
MSMAAGAGAPASAAAPRSFFWHSTSARARRRGHRQLAAAPGQPLKTLAAEGEARFAAIAALIAEWQPDALVVGVPFHPDGAEHDNTRRARASPASCTAASACRCTRSTSATPPPKRGRMARATSMPPPPRR